MFRLTMMMYLVATATSCSASKNNGQKTLEPIYGIEFTQSSIKLLISSNGCTTAGSFEIRQNHATISVVRIKGDFCRRRSFVTWIDLPFAAEPGPLSVKNKFLSHSSLEK